MEMKKTKRADLEKKRFIFLQFGILISMAIVFSAFEWRSYGDLNNQLGNLEYEAEEMIEVEMDEVIRVPQKMKRPKPKITIYEITDVIELESDIEDDEKEDDFNLDDLLNSDFGDNGDDGCAGLVEKFNSDALYTNLSIMPTFGKRESDLTAFIKNTLKFPYDLKNSPGEYSVEVEFIVEKDGSLSRIKILNSAGLDYMLVRNVKKMIEAMPNWNPGYYGTEPARAVVRQPIKITIK